MLIPCSVFPGECHDQLKNLPEGAKLNEDCYGVKTIKGKKSNPPELVKFCHMSLTTRRNTSTGSEKWVTESYPCRVPEDEPKLINAFKAAKIAFLIESIWLYTMYSVVTVLIWFNYADG